MAFLAQHVGRPQPTFTDSMGGHERLRSVSAGKKIECFK